jgi:hypothetical protein
MSSFFSIKNNMSIEKSNLSELYFNGIGSNWSTDSINLFIIVPLSSICLITNFICILVFLNLKFPKQKHNKSLTKQPPLLYNYFKANSINSCLFSLIMLFSFVTFSPRYIHISTSYFSKFYRCVVINYLSISLYSFGNFVDVIIGFERLLIFSKRMKKIGNIFSSYKLCVILVLFCLIINLPAYFWYFIQSEQEFYSSLLKNQFSYCGKIDFMYNTIFGKFLTGFMLFVRDILCLIFEITTGILLIKMSRKFLIKKKRLSTIRRNNNSKPDQNDKNLVKQSDTNFSLLSSQKPRAPTPPVTSHSSLNLNDKKMTLISIYLLFFTIITHTFAILCAIFHFIYAKTILSQYLILMTIFLVLLKNTCNFLIFFYLDRNFKYTIKNNNFCLK